MQNHLETISAALASDATEEARSKGAAVCRVLLQQLEPAPASVPPSSAPPIAEFASTAIAMLKTVPAEQLLDLAINTLRSRLPTGTVVSPSSGFSYTRVPMPQGLGAARTGGAS